MSQEVFSIPAITLRGVVIFPDMNISFEVARKKPISAIKSVLTTDRKIFVVTQRDSFQENPKNIDELYDIGVIVEIKQIINYQTETMRILVEGIERAKLVDINFDGEFYNAEVSLLPEDDTLDADERIQIKAITNLINNACEKYCSIAPINMSNSLVESMVLCKDPVQLFKNVVFNIPLNVEDKQFLLELDTLFERLTTLYTMLVNDLDVISLQKGIHDEVKNNMDKNQREYYMREQLKVLSERLGEKDSESEEYRSKIFELITSNGYDDAISEKLNSEVDKLEKMPPSSQEAYVIKNYLDTVLKLPWDEPKTRKVSIKTARNVLDKDHYGLTKVKERILETLAVQSLAPKNNGNIICLAGAPGIGKTSICKSIARSINRKYVRISLGGIRDEADIRGHRKTYIGAMAGRIVSAMIEAGVKNPVILLDEIDKMSNDFRGDPSSAMLEVLDKEQNSKFIDHYIEVPFDLSEVMFITTANDVTKIPAPLLDRMELIELPSYTREEKYHIAKEHLIPKQIKENGLKGTQIKFDDTAIYSLIDFYTKEAGVRTLERNISTLCRKTAKEIVEGNCKRITFKSENLEEYLGVKKYLAEDSMQDDEIGVVNGLAWTAVGGVLMPLETIALDGTGKIQATGSLGNVMKESSSIAVSYVRSIADRYEIPQDFYKTMDIHIHAPEGAVPKDGPSAGVTMVTSIVSTLAKIPVRHDVAMTGEITLHGKVLPIGGLREKSMAGYKAGIKTIIIPKGNEPDLKEVDETVKNSVNFVLAETLDDVLSNALTQSTKVPPLLQVVR
ncbi:MAG: endopeptidase La [Ruminococcus sp.]|nr:endopeptidase La [Ruminococcus sp.]